MKLSKVMICLDVACDRIPIVSTLSNIVDIALRIREGALGFYRINFYP